MIPVSRINDIERESLSADLEVLIDSDIGICFLDDPKHRAVHMLNHLEYDNRSLADEYERDIKAGLDTAPPLNLYPNGDTSVEPENVLRTNAGDTCRLGGRDSPLVGPELRRQLSHVHTLRRRLSAPTSGRPATL